jgi:hypothetical protein
LAGSFQGFSGNKIEGTMAHEENIAENVANSNQIRQVNAKNFEKMIIIRYYKKSPVIQNDPYCNCTKQQLNFGSNFNSKHPHTYTLGFNSFPATKKRILENYDG